MILTEENLKLPSFSSTPLPHTPSPNPPVFKVDSDPQARITLCLLNLHILNLFCSMPCWSHRFTVNIITDIMEGLGSNTAFAIYFSVTKVKEQKITYMRFSFHCLYCLPLHHSDQGDGGEGLYLDLLICSV